MVIESSSLQLSGQETSVPDSDFPSGCDLRTGPSSGHSCLSLKSYPPGPWKKKIRSLVPGVLATVDCPSNAPPRFVPGTKGHAGYRSQPRSLPGAKSGMWQLSVLALSFYLWCPVGRPLPDLQGPAMVSGLGLPPEQTGLPGEGEGAALEL